MSMKPLDYQAFRKYLDKYAPDPPACIICQNKAWELHGPIGHSVKVGEYGDDLVYDNRIVFPVGALICKVCGNTIQIAWAKVMEAARER